MTRCRCFLPDLAGFTGSNCTAPLSLIRREWDSNPRWSFPHTRFPSVLLQPLGHLSRLQSLPTLSQTFFFYPLDTDRPRPQVVPNFLKLLDQAESIDKVRVILKFLQMTNR